MHQFIRTNEDKGGIDEHCCHYCFCSSNDSVCILHHQKIITFLCHHMNEYDYEMCTVTCSGLQCMLAKNQGHLSAAAPASKLLGYAPI